MTWDGVEHQDFTWWKHIVQYFCFLIQKLTLVKLWLISGVINQIIETQRRGVEEEVVVVLGELLSKIRFEITLGY